MSSLDLIVFAFIVTLPYLGYSPPSTRCHRSDFHSRKTHCRALFVQMFSSFALATSYLRTRDGYRGYLLHAYYTIMSSALPKSILSLQHNIWLPISFHKGGLLSKLFNCCRRRPPSPATPADTNTDAEPATGVPSRDSHRSEDQHVQDQPEESGSQQKTDLKPVASERPPPIWPGWEDWTPLAEELRQEEVCAVPVVEERERGRYERLRGGVRFG